MIGTKEVLVPTVSYYGGPNTVTVSFGKVTLYFSYATCIAFRHRDAIGPYICGTDKDGREWSLTTSKHINKIPGSEYAPRATYEQFHVLLTAACDEVT